VSRLMAATTRTVIAAPGMGKKKPRRIEQRNAPREGGLMGCWTTVSRDRIRSPLVHEGTLAIIAIQGRE